MIKYQGLLLIVALIIQLSFKFESENTTVKVFQGNLQKAQMKTRVF